MTALCIAAGTVALLAAYIGLWRHMLAHAATEPAARADWRPDTHTHIDQTIDLVTDNEHDPVAEQSARDWDWMLHPAGGDLTALDQRLDQIDHHIRSTRRRGRSR